jgi:hypothetical protein
MTAYYKAILLKNVRSMSFYYSTRFICYFTNIRHFLISIH